MIYIYDLARGDPVHIAKDPESLCGAPAGAIATTIGQLVCLHCLAAYHENEAAKLRAEIADKPDVRPDRYDLGWGFAPARKRRLR